MSLQSQPLFHGPLNLAMLVGQDSLLPKPACPFLFFFYCIQACYQVYFSASLPCPASHLSPFPALEDDLSFFQKSMLNYSICMWTQVVQPVKRICLQCKRPGFDPWVGKIPWRREPLPTPVFLPGEFHGQRNLAGYSSWGCNESDTAE